MIHQQAAQIGFDIALVITQCVTVCVIYSWFKLRQPGLSVPFLKILSCIMHFIAYYQVFDHGLARHQVV